MIEMQPFADIFPPENIRHHFIGGVYSKELRIPRGFTLASHLHHFDHMSILAAGYVSLTVDDETRSFHAPHVFNIRAGERHTLRALSDAIWFCIHATDCVDPDTVDETLVMKESV